MKEITDASHRALAQYLLDHEYSIAYGLNDYGSLMSIFIEIFDRTPEED